MGTARPKKASKSVPLKSKAEAAEPIAYEKFVKDKPETEVDIAKAYDWTKHYSYDPAGNTYIRSLPEASHSDPRDLKPVYVTVCPKCDTEVEYDDPDTLYTCRNCGEEFKT